MTFRAQRILLLFIILTIIACKKEHSNSELQKIAGKYKGLLCISTFSPSGPAQYDTVKDYVLDVSFPYPDSISINGKDPNGMMQLSQALQPFTKKYIDTLSQYAFTSVMGMCEVRFLNYYYVADSVMWEDRDVCGPGGRNFKFLGKK